MAGRKAKKPRWWKNSFFWFAALLGVLSAIGFIQGDGAIRDPGQVMEGNLAWLYLGGFVIMLTNGLINHIQAVQEYAESEGGARSGKESPAKAEFKP